MVLGGVDLENADGKKVDPWNLKTLQEIDSSVNFAVNITLAC